jgi:hypothetical protein
MSLFAYLDPGAGSLLIQALIAGLIGCSFYFRQFVVTPVRAVWRLLPGRRDVDNQTQTPSA